jgi:N-acetylglucosamine kinase-like BadF-type ATPase
MNRAERRHQERLQRRAMSSPKQRAQAMRRHSAEKRIQTTLRLLNGHTEFTEAEQIKLTLPVRMALERIKGGQANDSDFHDLACAVNILIVCGEKISEQVLAAANQAAEALMRCLARHEAHGRWGLDGSGIMALSLALDIYQQLTTLVTAAQFEHAIQEARRRMEAGEQMEVTTA